MDLSKALTIVKKSSLIFDLKIFVLCSWTYLSNEYLIKFYIRRITFYSLVDFIMQNSYFVHDKFEKITMVRALKPKGQIFFKSQSKSGDMEFLQDTCIIGNFKQ